MVRIECNKHHKRARRENPDKDFTVIVDDCDLDLESTRWYINTPNHGRLSYAARAKRKPNGRFGTVLMHREIAARIIGRELTRSEVVDHINSNGLDNRRENLRVCTFAENIRNKRKKIGSKSPYKGITWHTQGRKWQATISYQGNQYYLGLFATPEEAHEAYCKKAVELHGEFANFGEMSIVAPPPAPPAPPPVVIPVEVKGRSVQIEINWIEVGNKIAKTEPRKKKKRKVYTVEEKRESVDNDKSRKVVTLRQWLGLESLP